MYQRLFLSPGMFRLALAAIVGSVGPVQLPLQIFFMRDFVTFQFFLPHQPLFHEAVEDVVIEGDRHPLFGEVWIGIVGDTKEVKIGVLLPPATEPGSHCRIHEPGSVRGNTVLHEGRVSEICRCGDG